MERYVKCLRSLKSIVEYVCREDIIKNIYFNDLWCKFILHEVNGALSNLGLGHYVDAVRNLKAVLEGGIQSLYYFTRYGSDEGAILSEVRRRDKAAVSFNIKMLGKIRGIHTQLKKDMLKLYLRISEFSHPTYSLLKAGQYGREKAALELLREVACNVCDYVAYSLIRLSGRESIPAELVTEVVTIGFRRVARYLEH